MRLGVYRYFFINPSLRYRIRDIFVPRDDFSLPTENALVLTDYTLDMLLADERVTLSQAMMLVNKQILLPDDFKADIAEYKDSGVIMNTCIMQAYEALAADVREKFDEKLYISSAYRTAEKQQQVYDENPAVATVVGASEHQTGLALDVYVQYYAGAGFDNCPAGKYVNANCQKFGFIIRYPAFGIEETGITYEPWHIRYVGQPHATIIAENEITLEEYCRSIKENEYYRYGDYIVTRTKNEIFSLPTIYDSMWISPDNEEGYIITVKVK